MEKPRVSIIIVNWNGGAIFKACLNSLSKLNYPNWELIVVDNGSVDGSQKLSPNSKLIQNKENLGFAKANNQGFKISSGKYILLLNNDTKVNQNFLSLLVDKLEEDSTIGVIQPKIFIWDKPGCLDNVASYLTKTGFLQHIGYMEKDNKNYNNERFTFSAKGACMLIRRELIEKVGLFDEDFGNYFEETDFCWRVWLLGCKVLFFPKAHIYHKVGFSSKRQNQTFIFYHSLKNRLLSMIKNFEFKNLAIIGGLQFFLISGLSFYYLLKFQFAKFLMIQKAIYWNIVRLGDTLRKRRRVQNLRKMSDSEIFEYILKPIDLQGMFSHFRKVEANFK